MDETLKILLLILVANGTPVLLSYFFSHRKSVPVDFDIQLKDQQPIFGATKTWRGIVASMNKRGQIYFSTTKLIDGE